MACSCVQSSIMVEVSPMHAPHPMEGRIRLGVHRAKIQQNLRKLAISSMAVLGN